MSPSGFLTTEQKHDFVGEIQLGHGPKHPQPRSLTNDAHSLPHVVEVQYGQQLVGHGSSHLTHADGLGGPGAEDEPEVARCCDQSSLVG